MRKAYFGTWSLVLIGINLGVVLFHLTGVFPYFYTSFYPMFFLLSLSMATVGYFEKDKIKTPSLIAGLLSIGLLAHWVIRLLVRLQVV